MIQLTPHIFVWTQIICLTVYLCGAPAVFNYPPICRALPSLLEKFLHVVLWLAKQALYQASITNMWPWHGDMVMVMVMIMMDMMDMTLVMTNMWPQKITNTQRQKGWASILESYLPSLGPADLARSSMLSTITHGHADPCWSLLIRPRQSYIKGFNELCLPY